MAFCLALQLFNYYSLKISNKDIIVIKSCFGSVITRYSLSIDDVESIELNYNPTVGRYSLTIISDDKIIDFRSRLPVADLIWLRDFVIRKLIGN